MFVRVLQFIAVTLYIFVAIGTVAYNGLAFYWLVPVLAPAIYFIFTLPAISAPTRPYVPPPPVDRTQINARIEELKSGPPHRNKTQYIDSISRGGHFSNERIDYFELTDLLVLCEHLRPLEAAMRAARLPMDNFRPGLVTVGCIMQVSRIQQYFHLDPCVVFMVGPPPDRHEPGVNIAQCTRCGQAIEETLVGGPWPAG